MRYRIWAALGAGAIVWVLLWTFFGVLHVPKGGAWAGIFALFTMGVLYAVLTGRQRAQTRRCEEVLQGKPAPRIWISAWYRTARGVRSCRIYVFTNDIILLSCCMRGTICRTLPGETTRLVRLQKTTLRLTTRQGSVYLLHCSARDADRFCAVFGQTAAQKRTERI